MLDGERSKRPKNKRNRRLLKESDKAAEEQELKGEESFSELNPKSRHGRADDDMNETDDFLLKETDNSGAEEEEKPESSKSKKKKRLLMEEAAKADQRGVCYLSRIPPHMDHVKLRQILAQYGEIQRIYLSPHDPSARAPRKRSNKRDGGFQERAFSEGWVEFTKKSVAKRVANMLNGEQFGGRKRSSFYYDLWNIKYLSKFKWDDLTEEIAYKNAIREQKLTLEISAAKRERDFYLAKVDQSRALSSIEDRINKKQKVQQESGIKSELPVSQQMKKVFRQFPQKQPVTDKNTVQSKPRLSKDILAGVFGGS